MENPSAPDNVTHQWLMWWLGTVGQQAITSTNDDLALWRRTLSRGRIELYTPRKISLYMQSMVKSMVSFMKKIFIHQGTSMV